MKNIVFTIGITLLIIMTAFTTVDKRDLNINTVVIDAGHGGKDSGTSGKISKEKDVALKIALELGQTINKYLKDVKVIYTRNTDNFVELEQRAEMANKNGAERSRFYFSELVLLLCLRFSASKPKSCQTQP